MEKSGVFTYQKGNPYDRNHLFRLVGALATFVITTVNTIGLVFLQSTDKPVAVGSRWGLSLVRMVEGWDSTWFQLKNVLCPYSEGSSSLQEYDWRSLWEKSYGQVQASDICGEVKLLFSTSTICVIISMVAATGVVVQTVASRLSGNPEYKSKEYFAHCKTATIFMIFCMFGICLPPIVFLMILRSSLLLKPTPLKLREGVFVGVFGSLPIILIIVGYHFDRRVLQSKMEFESLLWVPGYDERELYRQCMRKDIDALEAAKYGGLESPTDIARRAVGSPPERGVDRYAIHRAGAWQ